MTEIAERWQGSTGEASPSTSSQISETVLTLARAWARLPCPAVVAFKKVGDLQVKPDQITIIEELAPALAEDTVWFKLARASEQAWLGVNLNVCHEMIRAILGGASPRLVRPLGSAEKGLVAAMLASALSALGLAQRLTLALMDGQPCWQGQRVLLTGSIHGATPIDGRALFIGPLSWLAEGAGQAPILTSTENAVVEGVLVLARTFLSAADLGSATPGDAVVFDGIPSLDLGGAWPVTLRVGRFQASARLEPDSSLTLEGPWLQVEEGASAPRDDHTRWRPSESTDTASGHAEVIAELGRINLSGNELMALSRGEALSLGPRPHNPIALRMGGQLWATGELTTLGEQLSVRIVQLAG